MKTRIKTAFLLAIAVVALPACSTTNSGGLYQKWESHAYKAYKMEPPQKRINKASAVINPRSVNNQMVYLPEYGIISQPKVPIERISKKEKEYIAHYYGL